MEKCPKCGAERRRVGVMCPVRALCVCETRKCDSKKCNVAAAVVEFQQRIKGNEPKLALSGNDDMKFFCRDHAPVEFEFTEEVPLVEAPKRKAKSNVDPAWHSPVPPSSSLSMSKVECWKCHDIHPLKSRKMHNGTFSMCPKCGDDTSTPAE